jgi:serine/threonine-protein kinase RsbW
VRIFADINYLHDMLAYVRSQALQAGLSQLEAKRVELACEEIIVNIITYAYSDREGTIDLAFQQIQPGQVRVEIVDDGPPFDPLTVQADPDLELPLESRSEGGLGLFLVRQIVDELSYRREETRNIVTLTKKSEEK